MSRQNNEEMTIAEAKLNFAMAMEDIAPSTLVREYPLKSMGLFAAAGALSYLSSKQLTKSLLPFVSLLENLLKNY